jgi:hypothetical protein
MTSDQDSLRAEKALKQQERQREGRLAMAEYKEDAQAVREKTVRLRELRLARDIQAQAPADSPSSKSRATRGRNSAGEAARR